MIVVGNLVKQANSHGYPLKYILRVPKFQDQIMPLDNDATVSGIVISASAPGFIILDVIPEAPTGVWTVPLQPLACLHPGACVRRPRFDGEYGYEVRHAPPSPCVEASVYHCSMELGVELQFQALSWYQYSSRPDRIVVCPSNW